MKQSFLWILFLVFTCVGFAQAQTKITGKVIDLKSGEPIPFVNVIVKGTTSGEYTNDAGEYSISVPANATTLVFSEVGHTEQEVEINSRTVINVSMEPSATQLDEVVVVAYGTTTRAALTGSVSSISAKKMENKPITNISTALAGAAPGVLTTSASGQPGSGLNIRIRGTGSINSSNEPLYVLDGAPFSGDISSVNMDDVESVSILKDAASSALYGSRAANGVVMITTKRGRKDRMNIDFKMSQGIVVRGISEYERVGTMDYYPLQWDIYRNSLLYPTPGSAPTNTMEQASQKASDGLITLLGYNILGVADNAMVLTDGTLNPNARQILSKDALDWEKAIERKGHRQNYSLSASGGAEKGDYYVSASYLNETGYVNKSDFERYSARARANFKPNNWFRTGVNVGATRSVSNVIDVSSNTSYANPFYFARNIGSIYPIYQHNMQDGSYVLNEQGQNVYDLGQGYSYKLADGTMVTQKNRGSGASVGRHVIAENEWNGNEVTRNTINARGNVAITFLKDFEFEVTLSSDINDNLLSRYDNSMVGDGAPSARSRKTSTMSVGTTFNQILRWNRTFDKHTISLLAGHENYDYTYKNIYGHKTGVIVNNIDEFGNFTSVSGLDSYTDKDRTESYLSGLNYSYNNKYFLSASFRRDGSSRFAPNSRWGNFWSVGASWMVSRENFMQNVHWVNLLKFKASYGSVGNNGTLDSDGYQTYYPWRVLYAIRPNATAGGFLLSSVGNENLKWETSQTLDLGVDFGILDNRLRGSFGFFRRESKNLLFSVKQPLSVSYVDIWQNIGSMYNNGVEISLDGDIIRTKDFRWTAGVHITSIKNKITKLPNGDGINISPRRYEEGHSMYEYYMIDYRGVDPKDGAALYKADQSLLTKNAAGNITAANDMRIVGTDTLTTLSAKALYTFQGKERTPDVFGTITNEVQYKNLSLSFSFNYGIGGYVYDRSYASLMSSSNNGSALHVDALKSWRKEGDVTDVPRLDSKRSPDFNATSNRWLTSASYLQLANVTLVYKLPTKWINKLQLNNIQVYFSGENLFQLSKRKGLNVNYNFTGTGANVYVPSRIYTLGLNLSF